MRHCVIIHPLHLELETAWHKDGVITVEMSEVAQSEAAAGDHPMRKSKAYEYVFTETLASTSGEKKRLQEIEGILFPTGAQSENERNDVWIVFNAIKYEAILITNDGGSKRQPGGILGNRDALRKIGCEILTDAEAVEVVQELILKRNARVRRQCERSGEPLPHWVGKD